MDGLSKECMTDWLWPKTTLNSTLDPPSAFWKARRFLKS
jgi:hypothetical protein